MTLSATPAGTPVTVNYAYGDSTWSDLLTSYNGKSITYDEIGNPKKVGSAGLTWRGRQLTGLSNWNGAYTDYFYNADGIRIYKYLYNDNNGDLFEHFYTVDGSQILQEKIYESDAMYEHTLVYIYDEAGSPIGYRYREDDYAYADFDAFFFEKNLQGDVIAVYDSDGIKLASYTYDAWGNHTVTYHNGGAVTPARLNPFRYRGYYYDYETGLYYVSSRYYDPEIGRFINADAAIGQIGNVQGTNMFAYCFNNPVNMSDPTGNWPKLSTIFTVVAVAAVAVAAVAVTVATCGAAAPALAVAGGGIIGGISTGAAATAASVATGAMIVAGVSTAAAVTSAVAEKAVEKSAKQNNSVYVLKDDTGTVQYVGRTTDVAKRTKAHEANPARAGLKLEVIQPNLNYVQARAVEQAAMAYYHTINTANKMNNQINGISPFNPKLGIYKEAAVGMLGYAWNQVSNEILYWTGN